MYIFATDSFFKYQYNNLTDMKKILALVAILAIGLGSVNAQENLRWGVTAGMNSSKYSNDILNSRTGFHAGVKAEMALPQVAEGVYLEFGGLLTLKGAKWGYAPLMDIKFNPYYLEIPVHIGYKYAINENFSIFGNVGPYAAIGVFGKMKAKVDLSNAGGNIDWEKWGIDPNELKGEGSENIFGSDGMKRFDLGLGLKAGVEFNKKYQVSIGYDWGLLETIDNSDLKNRNLMISLSYMF